MKHWRTIIALAIDFCLNFLVFPGCRDIFCCNFCPSARYWWNKIVVSMLLTITVLSNCYWMDRLDDSIGMTLDFSKEHTFISLR